MNKNIAEAVILELEHFLEESYKLHDCCYGTDSEFQEKLEKRIEEIKGEVKSETNKSK